MHPHDLIVIAVSAGGVNTLHVLVSGLPATFPGALFIVLHLPISFPSQLPILLSRSAALDQQSMPRRTGKLSAGGCMSLLLDSIS